MDAVRCAVIGSGSMGRTHALNAEASGKARIVALCSRRIESAEALASRLDRQVPLYTDHRKMPEQIKPDALFVCLPPGSSGSGTTSVIVRYRVILSRIPRRPAW